MAIQLTIVLPIDDATWTQEGADQVEYDEYDWCSCTQMLHNPGELIKTAEGRVKLAAEAQACGCRMCDGTGIDPYAAHARAERIRPMVEWAYGNATHMFALFGLDWDSMGELTIAQARRAIMTAKARLDGDAARFERPEEQEHGYKGEDEHGNPIIGLRYFAQGLNEEGIRERLQAFEDLVSEAVAWGCQQIRWY